MSKFNKLKLASAIAFLCTIPMSTSFAQFQDSTMSTIPSMPMLPTKPGTSPGTSIITQVQKRSCTLPWGGSVTSGNSVTSFGTSVSSSCSSIFQSRTCNDGVLSGSYTSPVCTAPSSTGGGGGGGGDTTVITNPAVTPWYQIPGNAKNYTFRGSSTNPPDIGNLNIRTDGTWSGGYKEERCFYLGYGYPHNAGQCFYQGAWVSANQPGVTVDIIRYVMLGTVGSTGQLSGTWSRTISSGYPAASGSVAGIPSGSGLSGNYSNAGGIVDRFTAY